MNTDKLNSPQKITKLSLQLAPVRFQGKRPNLAFLILFLINFVCKEVDFNSMNRHRIIYS